MKKTREFEKKKGKSEWFLISNYFELNLSLKLGSTRTQKKFLNWKYQTQIQAE